MADRTDPPSLSLAALGLAWREHRPYVAFATVVFALSVVVGVAIAGEVDLFGLFGFESFGDMFPEDPGALFVFTNNTRAFFVFIAGALTGGILTTFGLVFNGILVGYVSALAAGQFSVGFVLLALAPHGVLELPALFVAAGVAYRLVGVPVQYVLGRRDHLFTRPELERTLLLVVVAWVALAVAAVVEIHVTTWLIEQVYGSIAA
ncbi:stage II sporulation protein M [Haloarchaeobius sp. HRN-SO-5]|uniref:stage II sporulation protein M n=1 Tax=Haloarchaeobius sp. HRN-SO-5 TaxID=3446118 RepID=UPI003EBCDA3E